MWQASKRLPVWAVVLAAIAVGIAPALAASTHEESVAGTATNSTSVSSASLAGVGTNELYLAAIFITGNVDVTSVSGGGLTWTERRQQCSGDGGQGLSVFSAFGSPPSAFGATATFASSANASIMILSRYSGVDTATPFENVTGENTVAENDTTCAGGSGSATGQLTLTSTVNNSILYVATDTAGKAISSADANYTERATANAGNGGNKTQAYVHDESLATFGSDTASHTISNPGSNWAAVGLVIRPAGGFSETPIDTATLEDASNLGFATSRASSAILSDSFTLNQGGSQIGNSFATLSDSFTLSHGVYQPGIYHEESVPGTAISSTSVSSVSLAGVGTNELYLAAIFITGNVDVTAVSGGGLTWTEQRQQCSGDGGQGLSVFSAFGSPPSAFGATATFASSANASIIILSRYSGADTTTPFDDVTGENTVAENDTTCTGGSGSTTGQLTLTSTVDNSVLYVATDSASRTISSADANYTERANANAGNGGNKTQGYVHDQTLVTLGGDTASHTISNPGSNWAAVGLVIRPRGAFSETPTDTAALGDSPGLDIGFPRSSSATLGDSFLLNQGVSQNRTSSATLGDTFVLNQGLSRPRTSSASLGDTFVLNQALNRTEASPATLGDSYLLNQGLSLPRTGSATLGDAFALNRGLKRTEASLATVADRSGLGVGFPRISAATMSDSFTLSQGVNQTGAPPANGSESDLSRDIDQDQIGDEIDGRFVDGRFVDQGNVSSSEFSDQHLGGSTFGQISNQGSLIVELVDAVDPAIGLQAFVSGQGETATLVICDDQFHLNLTDGDTVLMTCGSLTVTVLTGQAEVDLGQMLAVTLSSGATTKVTDLGNGRFAAENLGASGSVTAVENGNLVYIGPGERVEMGQTAAPVSPSTPESSVGQPLAPSELEDPVRPAPGIPPESSETTASAPSGTFPAASIPTPSLTPTSATTPLPQSNAASEPEVGPISFPPLPEDVLPTGVIGAIALGTLTGAAFIAILITLIGLVRSRFAVATPTRGK